jgi:hypothetical protein
MIPPANAHSPFACVWRWQTEAFRPIDKAKSFSSRSQTRSFLLSEMKENSIIDCKRLSIQIIAQSAPARMPERAFIACLFQHKCRGGRAKMRASMRASWPFHSFAQSGFAGARICHSS